MKSWTSCLLATTLVLVTVGPTAFAQQARGDWTAVQALAADADISIHLKTGKKVRGEFLSATDNELTITRKGKGESFAKDSIAQIERLERKAEKGKYAAIGAAIGTGVGAGIGGAKASSTSDDGYVYTIVGVAFGAGFGALGGFLFGQAKRKHVLIYQAP
ncbi:MAG: hypothetical protein ACXW3C_00735 [Pyrinomonadaceae bacterium]